MINAKLVKAKPSDVDLLFSWANDPLCRQNSFSSKMIEYNEHVLWFDKVLKDSDSIIYILYVDEIPCGQIRLTINESEAIISYSVAKEYRGNNFGLIMLSLIEKECEAVKQIKTLSGYVKAENIASQKTFEKSGYSFEKTENCYKYTKYINS